MRKSDLILPDYPIKAGDRSLQVARLQACLDAIYKFKGKNKLESSEPSYMGDNTIRALKSFQASQEMHITGVYDRLTRQKLRELLQCR